MREFETNHPVEEGQADIDQRFDMALVRPVGDESLVVVTRLNPTDEAPEYVGNVLRRTCVAVGEAACAKLCQLRGTEPETYHQNEARRCADRNLAQGLESLGIKPEDTLMVAVTGNEVGFGDRLGEYAEAGKLKTNPEGWSELPGFNAFFARAGEVPAIGSRLADCAHIGFAFKDRDGQPVLGFEHGTRTNMRGQDVLGTANSVKGEPGFDVDGQPATYTKYVIASALEHYGADPRSMMIRMSASIKPENFVKQFPDREKMESHIPGWYDAGYVQNSTNPDWRPGDPVEQTDEWRADFRGLILHDVMSAMEDTGIPPENLRFDGMLDPAESDGEFSSHQRRVQNGDSRDLYMIAHRSAMQG